MVQGDIQAENEKKIEMLKKIILIRRFEKTVKELYAEKRIVGAIHLCIGQEAVPVGICSALNDDDYVFSTHRGHGHAIAKTMEVKRIMAELMGKDTGLSRGHGGSMHLFDSGKGFMGGNGIVGGGIPLSLGAAFHAHYKETDQVSAAFFSDGASNQGSFSESLNLAALWKLPVLFVCENNQYAATTPVALSIADQNIAGRARAIGIPAVSVDGNDVEAVSVEAEKAVGEMRNGGGPHFIECKTYRIEPHCGIIPDQRKEEEQELWIRKDPVSVFSQELLRRGIVTHSDVELVENEAQTIVDEAVTYAEESPWPDVKALHNRSWLIS